MLETLVLTNQYTFVKIGEQKVSKGITKHKRSEQGINRELILTELIRSREALETAIAYVKAETTPSKVPVRAKTIKAGEGRAVAILSGIRDSGGRMAQREFEETCLRNCRTLVGAGGFIARGSIVRQVTGSGDVEYELTEKGLETIAKWEARYGRDWTGSLEKHDLLSNFEISDQQKIGLVTKL